MSSFLMTIMINDYGLVCVFQVNKLCLLQYKIRNHPLYRNVIA